MSTLLARKLVLNSFKRSFTPLSLNNNKYIKPYYYNQSRNVCFPVVMLGGFVGWFCINQYWNPYFDRSLLATLQAWSVGLTIVGFIIP
jgi:hypothetical protein